MRFRALASLTAIVATTALVRPAIADDRLPGAHAGRENRCSITVESDASLSATVIDAPLDEVMAEVARRTGSAVRWTEALRGAHVTLSFHRLPPIAAIAHLLAHWNYIVTFTRNDEAKPQIEVRIGSAIGDGNRDGATARVTVVATVATTGGSAEQVAASREGAEANADAAAEDRIALETVTQLVDLEQGPQADSPLRAALTRALAGNDALGVERATNVGLGALSNETLELAAASNDGLRPLALEILARRTEGEPLAAAALERLAGDGGGADEESVER